MQQFLAAQGKYRFQPVDDIVLFAGSAEIRSLEFRVSGLVLHVPKSCKLLGFASMSKISFNTLNRKAHTLPLF